MDRLDIGMYFPGMKDHDFPATIIPMSGPRTPLGNAEFGGRLRGTTGTGFAQFRVYGMYALVLLLRGGGRYRDRRGIDRRLAAGDLLVVFPEHPHQYGPEDGDEWDEVFVAFGGAAFEGWRANGLDPVNPVWPLPKTASWARRFFDILRMPHNSLAESTAVAAAIHQLIADALARRPATREDWLQNASQLLSGGADAPEIPAIASAVGLSHDRFRKVFKSATGESPSTFRRRRRLAQAALMLNRSDLKLSMIAHALGFCDEFHLSKAFKAEFGKSPNAVRSRIIGVNLPSN
jgi:AraC-like DNA-binding protein